MLRTLRALAPSGKRILLRVDCNVPIDAEGRVVDDLRLRATVPTIKYLIQHGNAVVIVGHRGRPGGRRMPELSLRPILAPLRELLSEEISFIDDCPGSKIAETMRSMKAGQIAMFENIRFCQGEESGDAEFSKELALVGEIFVNDAFGVSHRAHASVSGIAQFVPSYAGLLLEREVDELSKIIAAPVRPLAAILGGVKIGTKIMLIERFLRRADNILLGGAIANTVLKAKGIAVGKSVIDEKLIPEVRKLELTSKKLHLPVDVVVSKDMEGKTPRAVRGVGAVAEDEFILDIGPDTAMLFSAICAKAGMVVWNGPMGLVEVPQFAQGTEALVRAIAQSAAYSIIGGGDTTFIIQRLGFAEKINYLSTGGGAMLEFLSGKKLPGIEALELTEAEKTKLVKAKKSKLRMVDPSVRRRRAGG